MEVTDPADLVGPLAAVELAGASVLFHAEPLVLRLDRPVPEEIAAPAAANLRQTPTVTVVVGEPAMVPAVLADAADVCLTGVEDPPAPWVCVDPGDVIAAVASQPTASLALVSLLRASEPLDVWSAIAAESATYALLLGSEGHHAWLAARGPAAPAPPAPGAGPVVRAERSGVELRITLDRPEARNAVDARVRDALDEALAVAAADPSIEAIHLLGAGPDFCAGGDLREFGTTTDPGTAHAVRLTRHPGRSAHRVADRLHAHLHGHCIGAGIEVPAFARRASAHPDTRIALPELSMGLVPGAGGTVSLPRRIGRQRTAWLALTGATVGAEQALAWGLVDEITTAEPDR
jgi:enoyl-CoA hydratase/carnithine racemase